MNFAETTYSGVLKRYGHLLDLPSHTSPVTLLEGDTPLIPVPRLAEELGGGFELYVKFEGLNPTGSFKDRGMTAAISEAAARTKKREIVCGIPRTQTKLRPVSCSSSSTPFADREMTLSPTRNILIML